MRGLPRRGWLVQMLEACDIVRSRGLRQVGNLTGAHPEGLVKAPVSLPEPR